MQLSLLRNLFAAGLLSAALAFAQGPGGTIYKVSITNITKGQIISPVIVATHTDTAPPLWEVGSPASDELRMVAEDAMNDDMVAKLGSLAEVLDVKVIMGAGGPIMPGETASAELEFTGPYRWVSAVAMLVTTNDAFTGLNGVRGPNVGAGVHLAPAYDAGTEANTEMCAEIPGPPCGNVGVRMTEGAEGYVYIHPGISGEGDLTSSGWDWRNPVAKFVIERL
ncbi:MAG: spondin domain-containing protein [Bryobacterales bacterium]